MLGSLSRAASGSGRAAAESATRRSLEHRGRARAAPAPRDSDAGARRSEASAANAAPGGGRPRSRARGTRESGFTVASSGSPASAASARAARGLRQPVATIPERRPRGRVARSAGLSGGRRELPRIRAGDDREQARALEHGNGLDADARAAVDDRAQDRSHRQVEHAGDSPLVDEIGVLGQRRSRQDPAAPPVPARPRAPPAWQRGRRRCAGGRPAPRRARRRRRRHRRSPVRGRARTPAREPPRGQRHRWWCPCRLPRRAARHGPRPRAARSERARRSSPRPRARDADPERRAAARRRRPRRSRAPAAPGSRRPRATSRIRASGRRERSLRTRSPAAASAESAASSMSASAEWPGASSAISGRSGEGGAQFVVERDVAAEQGEPDDHAPSPRRSSRNSPARRPAASASATAGGSAQRDRDAARALAGGDSSWSPRAATREPSGRARPRRRSGPLQQAGIGCRSRRQLERDRALAAAQQRRARPNERAAQDEVPSREADQHATAGQRIKPADHRGRAIGVEIGTATTSRARTICPAGSACRSASTAVCGAPAPPEAIRARAPQRKREAGCCQPLLAQAIERGEAAHETIVPAGASGSRSVKRAPRPRATPTLTPPPCASATARTVERPMPVPPHGRRRARTHRRGAEAGAGRCPAHRPRR